MTPRFEISQCHRLLLDAVLQTGQPALEAWMRWQQVTSWQDSPVDWPSYRLLPAVYKNIRHTGDDTPGLARLKGLYRRAWYENTRLLHASLPALCALAEVGIPVLVFKGISLGIHYYKDRAARPMSDLDVLVPENDTHQALEVLLQAGWQVEHPYFSAEGLFNYYHGVNLALAPVGHVDLHRRLFADELTPGLDEPIWQAARPLQLEGLPVLRLSPEDELLLACMHGWRREEPASIRWIVDASQILQTESLDWGKLVDEAARRRMTVRAALSLAYLNNEFNLGIPSEIITELHSRPAATFELPEADWALRPQGWIPITAHKIYYWYIRQHGMPGGLGWWLGLLIEYLAYLRLTPSIKKFPLWFKRRLQLAGMGRK